MLPSRYQTIRQSKRRHLLIGAAAGFLLSAVFTGPSVAKSPKPLCQGQGVTVETSFARAGARACFVRKVAGITTIRVEVRPETTPINPSAWYGMRFVSRRNQPVIITLDYGTQRHRYRPHIQTRGASWQAVPETNIAVSDDRHTTRISLELARGGTLLAAQPFDPLAQMTASLDRHVASGVLTRSVIGQSVAGLPILAYATTSPEAKQAVVLLTRQHPPEVAGEWAFDAFVEAVLADTEQARDFRARFSTIIVPLINPDGIAGGYWRSNLGLVDLNRDWGPFTQPETRAVSSHILAGVANRPAIAVIDFHATDRDVIYAQPSAATLQSFGFVDRWLATWTAALGDVAPKIDRGHNISNANSKTWARLNLGVAAVTYEVGDNTMRSDAELRARRASETFMAEAILLPIQTTMSDAPAQ